MNNEQRKTIADIVARIGKFTESDEMRAVSDARSDLEAAAAKYLECREAASVLLDEIQQDVESQQSDEQDKFDNMPDGLQASERGQAMEAAIEQLAEAFNALGTASDKLREDDHDEFDATEVEASLSEATEALDAAVNN